MKVPAPVSDEEQTVLTALLRDASELYRNAFEKLGEAHNFQPCPGSPGEAEARWQVTVIGTVVRPCAVAHNDALILLRFAIATADALGRVLSPPPTFGGSASLGRTGIEAAAKAAWLFGSVSAGANERAARGLALRLNECLVAQTEFHDSGTPLAVSVRAAAAKREARLQAVAQTCELTCSKITGRWPQYKVDAVTVPSMADLVTAVFAEIHPDENADVQKLPYRQLSWTGHPRLFAIEARMRADVTDTGEPVMRLVREINEIIGEIVTVTEAIRVGCTRAAEVLGWDRSVFNNCRAEVDKRIGEVKRLGVEIVAAV